MCIIKHEKQSCNKMAIKIDVEFLPVKLEHQV